MKYFFLLLACLVLSQTANQTFGQDPSWPIPPEFKSYKDKPGRVSKYNSFNYLDIRDESGEKSKQRMGRYWEIAYSYDSAFRQKRKFKEFFVNQVIERNGALFFQDTLQVHFVVPENGKNIWGRLVLSNDKVYRLRLIQEGPFINSVKFDVKPDVRYEKFVDSVNLPPRITFLPSSCITRTQYSKFNHQEFSWNSGDTLFSQIIMGPFWDLKVEVRNKQDDVDKSLSTVEIMESYYRACQIAGGKVIKSRPRELLFSLPYNQKSIWCRITASLDGVYFVKVVMMDDKDRIPPSFKINPPLVVTDSSLRKSGDDK
jgi:hypothetical protein